MLDSDDPVVIANAEVYRIATQEWQDVARSMGSDTFDAQYHLDSIMSRWNRYVATGKQEGSIEEVQENVLGNFVAEDRAARARARKRSGLLPEPEPKKVKAKDGDEIGPDDPRNYINPSAIVGIINQFRLAFGIGTI